MGICRGRENKCTAVTIENMEMIVSCDTVGVDWYGFCDCCVVKICWWLYWLRWV